jgi:pimeloyl-ACP methyl ester carboxylesterase
MTQLLDAFIKAKGLKKVFLVGQDFSGLIAIDYALTFPDKVAGLVLVSPYGAVSTPVYYPMQLLSHYPRWISRHFARDKAGRVDIWRNVLKIYGAKTYQKLFYMEPSKIYQSDTYKEGQKRLIYNDNDDAKKFVNEIVDYKFNSGWMKTKDFGNEMRATHLSLVDAKRKDYWGIISMKGDKRTDWITRMRLIQAPTLIIRGQFDPVVSAKDAKYMNNVIHNSNLSTYDKSAHYPMVEEAKKFNEDVLQFLGGCAATSEVKK